MEGVGKCGVVNNNGGRLEILGDDIGRLVGLPCDQNVRQLHVDNVHKLRTYVLYLKTFALIKIWRYI